MTDRAADLACAAIADADAAAAENMDIPMTAVLAHAAMKNLRTKSPLREIRAGPPWTDALPGDIIGASARWQE